jgi:hypothetical protein
MIDPFLLANEKIGAIEVRPFSLITQRAIDSLSKFEFNRTEQAASMLWVQMREPAEVKAALTNGTLEKSVRDFAESMPLVYLIPIEQWVERQQEMIAAGRIEIIPRDTSTNDPGNLMGQSGAKVS